MTHVLPDPLLAAPDPRSPLLPASPSAQPWPRPPAAGATSLRRGSALHGLGHCFSGSLSPVYLTSSTYFKTSSEKLFWSLPPSSSHQRETGSLPLHSQPSFKTQHLWPITFCAFLYQMLSAPGKLDCVLIMPGFPGSHIPGASPYPVISE